MILKELAQITPRIPYGIKFPILLSQPLVSKFDSIISSKYKSCATWFEVLVVRTEEGDIGQTKGTNSWFISISNRGCRGGWEGDVLIWSIQINYFLSHFCRIHQSVNRYYLRAIQETFSSLQCILFSNLFFFCSK